MREQNVQKINAKYLETAKKLQDSGSEAIVICVNTPHMIYSHVQPEIGIPILHIADAVGIEASKKQLKTLGLLGNKPTMTKGFIQSRIKDRYAIDTIIPDELYLDRCHHYVSKELTQGKFTKEANAFFIRQMQLLKIKGAAGIILGCTELPILLEDTEFDLPLLATTQLHAQMAVDFILSD